MGWSAPLDTFEVDPLTPVRPSAHRFASSQQEAAGLRCHEKNKVIETFTRLLDEEKAAGFERQMQHAVARLTGFSPEKVARIEAHSILRQEQEALAAKGDATSLRPVAYMSLALFGRSAIGLGSTLFEHLVVPGQPNSPGAKGAEQPNGSQRLSPLQQVSPVKIMGGSLLLVAGASAALGAAYLFWCQAKIARPTRAKILAGAHISSLLLAIAHSFLFEWLLFNRPLHDQTLASILSMLSVGIYSYTVPNSFTAAETQLGLTPVGTLDTRMEVALALGAVGSSLYIALATLAPHPNVPSYAKQAVLIGAGVCYTSGFGLAFSNARNWRARVGRGMEKERERVASVDRHYSLVEEGRLGGPRRPTALPENALRRLSVMRPPLQQRQRSASESQSHIIGRTTLSAESALDSPFQANINPLEPSSVLSRRPVSMAAYESVDYFNHKRS